jgi:LuxR family quorum-sensing system transcriptional regulator CciR
MKRALRSAVANLRAAETLEEAIPVLKGAGELLGLPMVTVNGDYSSNRLLGDGMGGTLAAALGWSADILTGWSSEELTPFSPVGAACRLSSLPFAWRSESFACPVPTRIEAPQERVLDFLTELGVTGGITTPVHLPFSRIGSVTWFSFDRKFNFDRVLEEHEDSFFLLGHYFMALADSETESLAAERAFSLSRREIECLTWVALGKTDTEIAAIIGRSMSTARFHVDKAVAKLNAVSRTQAVAKAAQLGMIGAVV